MKGADTLARWFIDALKRRGSHPFALQKHNCLPPPMMVDWKIITTFRKQGAKGKGWRENFFFYDFNNNLKEIKCALWAWKSWTKNTSMTADWKVPFSAKGMQNRLGISKLRLCVFEMTRHNTVNLLRRHFRTKDVGRRGGERKRRSGRETER